MALRDPLPVRYGLKLLIATGRVTGGRRVRPVAAMAARWGSRNQEGYAHNSNRLVSRASVGDGFQTFPEEWWSESPIVHVRRLGISFQLDLRDNLQRILYFTGSYEPATLSFLRRELRKGDLFVDVGAHIGLHSLVAARALLRKGGGVVVAFEPASDSAAKLRAGARVNRLSVEVVELALGPRSENVVLYSDPDWGADDAGVRSRFYAGLPIQEMRVARFDEWIAERQISRIDVIKLDVEGAECGALSGMKDSLSYYRPRALIVEIKDSVLRKAKGTAVELRGLLASFGYESTGLRFDYNEVFRPSIN